VSGDEVARLLLRFFLPLARPELVAESSLELSDLSTLSPLHIWILNSANQSTKQGRN